jgi:hypothetical protein
MDKKNPGSLYRLLIPLLILTVACSLSPSIPIKGGNGYRYDRLFGAKQQGSAIANYRAISKWANTDSNYYFINGTDQLPGDTEQQVITQAFAVWAAQAPLTFTLRVIFTISG